MQKLVKFKILAWEKWMCLFPGQTLYSHVSTMTQLYRNNKNNNSHRTFCLCMMLQKPAKIHAINEFSVRHKILPKNFEIWHVFPRMKLFNGTKGQTNTNVTHVLKCNIHWKFLRSGFYQFLHSFKHFQFLMDYILWYEATHVMNETAALTWYEIWKTYNWGI